MMWRCKGICGGREEWSGGQVDGFKMYAGAVEVVLRNRLMQRRCDRKMR